MGFVSSLVSVAWRVGVDLCVLMIVFVLLPGIPPHVTYSNYERLPPPLPLEGVMAPNTKLDTVERILNGKITGPESVASRKDDEVFVSLHGGKILRLWGPDFDHFKIVTSIGPGCDGPWQESICGRPLGLRFAPDGKLIVADSYLGLFSLDVDTAEKKSLFNVSEPIDGLVPMLPNDVDIDNDGYIYWTDSSTVSHLCDSVIEMMSDPSGRVLRFDPKTGTNTVLLKNLHFPNGIQLSPDQDFLIFTETGKFRAFRHWLKGPKTGKTEIFIEGLPGYPDNIRAREGGGYYIPILSVPSSRNRQLNEALGNLSLIRKLLIRLLYVTKLIIQGINQIYPNVYLEKMAHKILHSGSLAEFNRRTTNLTIVLETDEDGNIVDSWQGNSGRIVHISEAVKVGDSMFFGSPYNYYLGRIDLNPPSMEVEGQSVRMKDMDDEEKEEDKKTEEKKEEKEEEDSTKEESKKEEIKTESTSKTPDETEPKAKEEL